MEQLIGEVNAQLIGEVNAEEKGFCCKQCLTCVAHTESLLWMNERVYKFNDLVNVSLEADEDKQMCYICRTRSCMDVWQYDIYCVCCRYFLGMLEVSPYSKQYYIDRMRVMDVDGNDSPANSSDGSDSPASSSDGSTD